MFDLCECLEAFSSVPSATDVLHAAQRATVCTPTACYDDVAHLVGAPGVRAGDDATVTVLMVASAAIVVGRFLLEIWTHRESLASTHDSRIGGQQKKD